MTRPQADPPRVIRLPDGGSARLIERPGDTDIRIDDGDGGEIVITRPVEIPIQAPRKKRAA